MSGANIALKKGANLKDVEDGILTAQEISTLDLRGLELAVLSACQTGIGDIAGDGVFGLQRGFKKAGANTLLMSLWKVDDNATHLLMTEFYKNLLAGESKFESLRKAQKYVRDYEEEIEITPNKRWESQIRQKMNKSKEPAPQKIKKIKDNSVLFVPHPIYINKRFYIDILKKTKEKKNIKLIFLIHDLDSLRKMFPESEKEFKHIDETMYKIADYIIAHNSLMKNYLVNQGIDDKKIYELGIFDYLAENNLAEKEIKYSKTINIAGNLDTNKCKYIKGLNTLDKSVKVNLYGLNFNKDILNSESISYKGAFPADEIPSKLNEGFGLVWDGDGIDGCTGNTGNYLRYNNPHKLSLYLVSGLPVVIWSEAAEAQFVKDNNVGIIVDSIDDFSKKFDELSEQQYYEMVENAKKISGKLRNGEYLSGQISQIRDDIEKAEI